MDFKKFVNDIYLNENTINQLKDSYVNSENILKLVITYLCKVNPS